MQASARLASSAASKKVIASVHSTFTRSYYGASRGKAHAAPLSAQELPPPKGQKKIPKKERRVMVEEYVQKYRASNEGKFPTISHVRQVIGGTHYTVREVLQEMEYNHANPPLQNAKAAEVQGIAPFPDSFPEKSWPKDDNGKNPDNLEACKSDQKNDGLLSLEDATAGTATIEKTETCISMGSDHIVETEAVKPDFNNSEPYKMVSLNDINYKNVSLNDIKVMLQNNRVKPLFKKDSRNEPVVSLGVEAKSDLGKQEGKTEATKNDLNNTVNSLSASKSTVSDQSGSDTVIKGSISDSEHSPKHKLKESTEAGLLGSLKSFASGFRNFWKSL